MAYIRTLENGKYRADVRMKGIVKNKTFTSQSLAQAWADKIEHSIKTIPNMEMSALLELSDADIDNMGGDELFDLFAIRKQARLAVINRLTKRERLQLSVAVSDVLTVYDIKKCQKVESPDGTTHTNQTLAQGTYQTPASYGTPHERPYDDELTF